MSLRSDLHRSQQFDAFRLMEMNPAAAVRSLSDDVRSRLVAQSPPQVGRIGNQCPVPAAFEKIEHRFDLRSHAAAGKLALGEIATPFFETHVIEPALPGFAKID